MNLKESNTYLCPIGYGVEFTFKSTLTGIYNTGYEPLAANSRQHSHFSTAPDTRNVRYQWTCDQHLVNWK
ncbi:hypothetical protein RRF57_012660 [Xylaria bambusicola]|uniref:Uncharacterized protein n=1 Tax=Xylaria bambusicola TaxID=326684 RepID=A0AAN7UZT8_9PEZI